MKVVIYTIPTGIGWNSCHNARRYYTSIAEFGDVNDVVSQESRNCCVSESNWSKDLLFVSFMLWQQHDYPLAIPLCNSSISIAPFKTHLIFWVNEGMAMEPHGIRNIPQSNIGVSHSFRSRRNCREHCHYPGVNTIDFHRILFVIEALLIYSETFCSNLSRFSLFCLCCLCSLCCLCCLCSLCSLCCREHLWKLVRPDRSTEIKAVFL
jgi:hypothetical protein